MPGPDRQLAEAFRNAMRVPRKYERDVNELCPNTSQFEQIHRGHRNSFVICFSNRCGSNFLAQALASDGRLGLADEYFNINRIRVKTAGTERPSFSDHVQKMLQEGVSATGWFGCKLAWFQLDYFLREGVIPDWLGEPCYIFMKRRDLLDQAISWYIAENTRQWLSTRSVDTVPEVPFDGERILRLVVAVAEANARFEAIFGARGIQPVRVYYEDLHADAEAEVARTGRWLGISDLSVNWQQIRLHRQSTRLNKVFRERILTLL